MGILTFFLIFIASFVGVCALVYIVYVIWSFFELLWLRMGKELKDPEIPKSISDKEDLVKEYQQMLPTKPTSFEIANLSLWKGFLEVLHYEIAMQLVNSKFESKHKGITLYGSGHYSGGYGFGGGSFCGGGAGGSW